MVAAGLATLLTLLSYGLTDKSASERDFIQYWAAAHLLVQGGNPYDAGNLLRLEHSAGMTGEQASISLSPPLVLLPALPLAWMGPKAGLIFWLSEQFACILAAIAVLWRLNGRSPRGYHWIGLAFAPALACLMSGQIGIFLMLAIVLFLYWHEKHPWLAGAALTSCLAKPHLFLAFGAVMTLWVVSRRAYRIVAGFAIALAASCILIFSLDRQAWFQWMQLSQIARVQQIFVPTLSDCFRLLVNRNAYWLQFLPAAASCLWSLWYFWTRRERWDWMDHGMLVLLVAVVCAPYAFFCDESLLLPAVLAGAYRAAGSGRSLIPFALVAGAALLEVMAGTSLISPYYLWTAPAWLGWYLYATRRPDPIRTARPRPA
jgi:hypothetical protein